MIWSFVACLGESGGTCNDGRYIHKGEVTLTQKFMSSNLGYSEFITYFGLSF